MTRDEARLDVRVLGPLQVIADGTPLRITAPMQRAVLVALLLRANRVVPLWTLIDDLWGPQPPDSAEMTVRNYVRRLRQVLPTGRLHTHSPGYLISVDDTELDLAQFTATVREARAAADENRLDRAVDLFARATTLWRGPPLADVPAVPLRSVETPQLEEQYVTALEDGFDVRLRLGQHVQICDELAALHAKHPARERLARLLMLALYRSGRGTRALEVYRSTRGMLIDELGIEPGPDLSRLQEAMLRHDPDLAWDPAAVTTSGGPGRRPTPMMLPARVPRLVGRGWESAALRQSLVRTREFGRSLCLVNGPGGVGKSALAVSTAHEAAAHFPDGVLYSDLHGATPGHQPVPPAETLVRFLRELDPGAPDEPQDLAALSRLYQDRLRGRRVLVVLDNATDATQVAPLVPDQPGCAALVTSRKLITGFADAQHVHLDPLPASDAVALLAEISGSRHLRSDAPEGVELVQLCGRLPLALRVIGTRMAGRPHWPPRVWAERLTDERHRLDMLIADDLDVRTSLAVSLEQLERSGDDVDRDAARLLTVLGLVDLEDLTAQAAAALSRMPVEESENALERLVDAQLAFSAAPGRYSSYDLVATLARERARAMPPTAADAAIDGLCAWYLANAARFAELFDGVPVEDTHARPPEGVPPPLPLTNRREAQRWLDQELTNLLALAQQVAGTFDFPRELLGLIRSYFVLTLHRREHEQLCDIVRRDAIRGGDRRGEALALAQRAIMKGQEDGRDAVRMLQRSRDLFDELGDVQESLGTRNNLVAALTNAGRTDEAIRTGRELVEDSDRLGDDRMEIVALSNLGHAYVQGGDHEEGMRYLRKAATLSRTHGYFTVTLDTLASMANSCHSRDDHESAAACAREILELHDREHDTYVALLAHHQLASSLRALGRNEEAETYRRRAADQLGALSAREKMTKSWCAATTAAGRPASGSDHRPPS